MSKRSGNAVLEAALVLPLLLLLMFGTIEFSHFFYVRSCLQGAAREGVRTAVLPDASNAEVRNRVDEALTTYGLRDSGYRLNIEPADVSGVFAGQNISVSLECTWGDVGVRPLGLMSAERTLRGAAVMRKER